MPKKLMLSVLLFSATGATAQCPADQQAILSCTINAGKKQLVSCQDGTTATYAFGGTGQVPDLSLAVPVHLVDYTPWNGVGRSIFEQVVFQNANVSYTVWAAFEKDPDVAQPLSGGVLVRRNGQDLANLMCDPETIEVGIDRLFGVMESQGQCWDYSSFVWSNCN